MPREKDPFRDHVEFLQNNESKWKCKFCKIEYGGSVTRIKAHLAGFGGYGIKPCKKVNPRVRSDAQKVLKHIREAESSNGSEGNVEEDAHQPLAANNEDAPRETSVPAVPYQSLDGVLPSSETNFPNQFPPVQVTIPQMDYSFRTQPPQHHAGDADIQPRNMSDPSGGGDLELGALANMPGPLNAEEGEPNTEVPQGMFKSCEKVDPRVRLEARKVLKPRGEAESSNGSEGNVEEDAHQPLTANNEDAPRETSVPAVPYQSFDEVDYSFRTQPPQHHAGDSYIQPWNMSDPSGGGDLASMPGPMNAEEGEPITEIPQDERTDYAPKDSRPSTCGLVDKNMQTRKRKLEEVSNREADMDELESWCKKSLPLVTTELVGKQSEEAIKKICDYLMENEIVIIGIYGMGGVGKTAILMQFHNRVLLENPTFSNVFWVSVPQKFSVYELQDEIANAVGLYSLSKDKDVKRRASILHRHLEKMKGSILLLDGLWMHFEVKDVGIPIKKGGLKLVLTTRSLDVCHKMLCDKHIKIKPLSRWEEDAWSLFLEKLAPVKELPSEVEEIARSIVDKFRGLPRGIIETATHMRRAEKVHEWEDLLQKLQDSTMELDVLKELKLSYMNLCSPQVQRCFLHLVLCFEKCRVGTTEEELIESLIDEGLLGGIATRKKQRDQGNTILDKMRKSCLLDGPEEEEVSMIFHPLIMNMALQIVTSTTHMVRAGMELEEIPEEELWTDRLEKVFLQSNRIREIPYGISPNCPKLTRLSLNGNFFLKVINESFFRHLNGLKVLDLSYTLITELPDSISHLESLEALLLQCCKELHCIPSIGKLGSLKKLHLKGCRSLKDVPEGMEMLVKLTYLNLHDSGIETLPEGVLGKLLNLQYLAIKKVRAGEATKLKKVEALYCSVPNVETFNACTRFLEQNSSQEYSLGLNESCRSYHYKRRITMKSCASIAAWKDGGIGGDGRALLPKNVQELEVGGCSGVTRLCEVGPLENLERLVIKEWENLEVGSVNFPRLKILTITRCPKLKRVLLLLRLPSLRQISVENCEGIEEIIGGGPLPSGVTCGLTHLTVEGCHNMKRVLTRDMLLHLPFLEIIRVQNCKGIEVIVGSVANNRHCPFPNITELTLSDLPELKSICDDDGTMSSDSLRHLCMWNCPKLKRLPRQLPLLPSPPPSLRQICIDPQTRESLEWDHPGASSSLERFVIFVKCPEHLRRYLAGAILGQLEPM